MDYTPNPNNPYAGAALVRPVSRSLVAPQSLTGYEDFFRLNSRREDGWMDASFSSLQDGTPQQSHKQQWTRLWFCFDNREGVLKYSSTPEVPEPEMTSIPMSSVQSLKTMGAAKGTPATIIRITTDKLKISLRPPTPADMNRWTFCFQMSVALVITILTRDAQRSSLLGTGVANGLRSPTTDRFRYGAAGEEMNGLSASRLLAAGGVGIAELGRQTAFDGIMGEDQPVLGRSPNIPIMVPIDINQQQDVKTGAAYKEASSLNALGIFDFMNAGRSGLLSGDAQHQSNENLVGSTQGKLSSSPSVVTTESMQTGVIRSQSDELLFFLQQQEQQQLNALSSQRSFRCNNSENSNNHSGAVSRRTSDVVHDENSFSVTGKSNDEVENLDDSYMMFDLEEMGGNECSDVARDSIRSVSRTSASPSVHIAISGGQKPTNQSAVTGTDESFVNRSGFLMWECGYCTLVGPKDRNEDRFECRAWNSTTELESVRTHLDPPSSSSRKRAAMTHLTNSNTYSSSEVKSVMFGGGKKDSGGYFGVYDGHSGVDAAIYAEKELFDEIVSHENFSVDICEAISSSCKQLDNSFLDKCEAERLYSGTTAIGVFLIGSKLVVFNIGDCQAVLCSDGVAREMNDPHRPERRDESDRIQAAGGWLEVEREIQFRRLHQMDLADPMVYERARQVGNFITTTRVCGDLAVSRSIGDPDLKRVQPGQMSNGYFNWPDDHDHIFHADLVIADPEFVVHAIDVNDEFIIIASDGLWDVISTSEGINIAREQFNSGKTPMEVANHLGELALRLGVYDNVTVIAVRFIHSAVEH